MAMALLCGAKCPRVNDYASLLGLYGAHDLRRGETGESRRGRDRAREFERLRFGSGAKNESGAKCAHMFCASTGDWP
jgi:hypothetical protein